MVIGLAGLLNLLLGGGISGAIAFGLGLLAVCALKLDLFTGKIRNFINREISLVSMVFVFIGNIVGIVLICALGLFLDKMPEMVNKAEEIMAARAIVPFYVIIFRGILCGICV